jgi:hypothetical protein
MKRRTKFHEHRHHAAARGIPFTMTFEQWWEVRQQSGHWHERGRGRGKYVMARFGDRGGYEVGNVKVCSWEENAVERRPPNNWLGRRHTAETKAKMSAARIGRPPRRGWKHASEVRAKIAAALRGRKCTPGHRAAMSVAAKIRSDTRPRDAAGRWFT